MKLQELSGNTQRLEAIQIRIVKKETTVQYSTHVQNIGWQAI